MIAPPKPRWLDASRSATLLRRAAAEFFEEGYALQGNEGILAETSAELQGEARQKLLGKRSVPDGCYTFIGYLVWLERAVEIADLALDADEGQGLMLLKQERARFQCEHPPCPHCGMPNARHELRCRACVGELRH